MASKTVMLPNARKDVEQQELSVITSGMQNETATLESSLVISYTLNTLISSNKFSVTFSLLLWDIYNVNISPLHVVPLVP